MPFPMGHPL